MCKESNPVDVWDEEEMAKVFDEIANLEEINRNLKKQIKFNEIRIKELRRCVNEEFLIGGKEDG